MESTLNKKIKGYSTLAGSLLAMANVADGQIVYTDLADVTVSGDGASYDLDLNNDGTVDYRINITSNGGTGVKMLAEALGNNAIAGTAAAPYFYPYVMDLNDVIGPDLEWNGGANQTMAISGYYPDPYGNWFGEIDKYLGLRLDMGSDNHYGWARLDVSDDAKTLTVKDYAYESTAETEIMAGATGGVGVSPLVESEMNIFTMEHQIYVQLNNSENGLISVSNLVGQQVKAAEITGTTVSIDMKEQPAGIYLVSVNQNNERFTQKVTIK
ncbi:MAG: T9SS type A sorting domain-containing protein [Chitinophagales bacterium]|nr:T9SS type A sorting domain-containing protein [Chitinophagales bacterium]